VVGMAVDIVITIIIIIMVTDLDSITLDRMMQTNMISLVMSRIQLSFFTLVNMTPENICLATIFIQLFK
jgi:hypothetical protein